ncbi:hypothetical protein [Paenibacillus agilis]|nr:hypothetical protein [Paenibacillus agilis]
MKNAVRPVHVYLGHRFYLKHRYWRQCRRNTDIRRRADNHQAALCKKVDN